MKEIIKKLILVFLGSLCLLSVGFSTLTDGNVAYWAMENTSDSSGNGNTLTEYNGVTHSTGIIDNGYSFDGVDDYLESNLDTNYLPISISLWFNKNTLKDNEMLLNKYVSASYDGINIGFNSNNEFVLWYFGDSNNKIYPINYDATNYIDGKWHHIVFVVDNNGGYFYLDNTLIQSLGWTGNPLKSSTTEKYKLMKYPTSTPVYTQGKIDEVAIYDRALTEQEISELYNNGLGYNPYNQITPTIQTNITQYYNKSNISIKLNTTSNTNMSYILDNQSKILICSNCNETTLNITNLSEGTHSILFESKYFNGVVNSMANFTIDLTKPIINLFNISEINSYTINLSQIFNYLDLNLDSCQVKYNIQNLSCNQTFTFNYSGNKTLEIIVKDKASNQNKINTTILINPFVYFYVYDTKRKINLTNYYIDDIQSPYDFIESTYYYKELMPIKYYNIKEKVKIYKELYPLTYQNISNGEKDSRKPIQLNLTPATLNIRLFDYDSKNQLNNWSISINKFGINYLNENNLSNFSIFYSEKINGDLNIELNKYGYFTSYLNPRLELNSSIQHNVYLVQNSNPKIFPLEVKDRTGLNYLSDVIISVYITDTGITDSYFTTQVKTDSTGKVYLYLDSNKNYKLVLSKDGYVRTIEYITSTDYQLTFYMAKEIVNNLFDYAGFTYSIQKQDLNNNITEFSCYYNDDKFLINSVECSVTRDYDTLFNLKSSSINSLSDKLYLSIPRELQTKNYDVKMRVIRDGKEYIFHKQFKIIGIDEEKTLIENKLSNLIENSNNLKPFLLIPLAILFMLIGLVFLGSIGTYLGLLIFLFISLNLSLLSGWLVGILTILTLSMLGFKLIFGGNN